MEENRGDLDAVMRRIEKLLALAGDSRANPNEAAAAAAMAERVMAKYQIEIADVIIAKMKSGEGMGGEDIIPTLADWPEPLLRVPKWASLLATKVARFTETRGWLNRTKTAKGYEACLRFSGFKPDVMLAIYMMSYFQTVMRSLRDDFKKTGTYKLRGVASLRAYTDGLAYGIMENLDIEIERREVERKNASLGVNGPSDSRELVLVDAKRRAVDEAFGEQKTKKTTINTEAGFSAGVRDGRNVSVKKPLENNGNPADSITALLG